MKNISIVAVVAITLSLAGNAESSDYSLSELYGMALARAERIRISEADIGIAEKSVDKANAVIYPRVTASGGYVRYSGERLSSTGAVMQPESSMNWYLKAEQSFSTSGREFIAMEIAKSLVDKSGRDLEAVKNNYLLNISGAYFDALRAGKNVENARSNMERLKKHRDAAVARLKAGEATKTDLLRAEAELSGAEADMLRADNGIRSAKAVLARLAGIDGEFGLREPDGANEPDISGGLEYLKSRAIAGRAEVKASGIQRDIAARQVAYVKGAYKPTVSVEAAYTGADQSPASSMLNRSSVYAGIRASWLIYDGGLRRADAAEAVARSRQTELLYDDTLKTIGVEVENAWLDLETNRGVLKSSKDRAAFARDNFAATTRKYELGLASSLDVIDANNLLSSAEKQEADASYGVKLTEIRLKRVTGTLVENGR
jgi:outer membrane protein